MLKVSKIYHTAIANKGMRKKKFLRVKHLNYKNYIMLKKVLINKKVKNKKKLIIKKKVLFFFYNIKK